MGISEANCSGTAVSWSDGYRPVAETFHLRKSPVGADGSSEVGVSGRSSEDNVFVMGAADVGTSTARTSPLGPIVARTL